MTSFVYQSEMAASSYGMKDEAGQKGGAGNNISKITW